MHINTLDDKLDPEQQQTAQQPPQQSTVLQQPTKPHSLTDDRVSMASHSRSQLNSKEKTEVVVTDLQNPSSTAQNRNSQVHQPTLVTHNQPKQRQSSREESVQLSPESESQNLVLSTRNLDEHVPYLRNSKRQIRIQMLTKYSNFKIYQQIPCQSPHSPTNKEISHVKSDTLKSSNQGTVVR